MPKEEDPMVRALPKTGKKERASWIESAFGGVAWALGLIPLEQWADATPRAHDHDGIRQLVAKLDDDQRLAAVADIAALLKQRVPPSDSSPSFDRGYRAHDRVMRAILVRDGDGDALLHAMMEHDADSLRLLLKFPPAELLDPGFREGFEAANRHLALVTREAVQANN